MCIRDSIYLGDEIGTLNDYSFLENPEKADDSRWVHRPFTNWNNMGQRKDPESIEGRIYQGILRLIDLRKSNPAFNGQQTQIVDLDNTHLLGYTRSWNDHRALVIVNFSEQSQSLQKDTLLENPLDALSLRLIQRSLDPLTTLEPYQFLCLEG
jgi:glycosidase